MTADGYRADPAALRAHGATFSSYADRAGAIHRQLSQALEDAGDCWGSDAAGQSFAAGHLPGAQGTLAAIGGLPDKLTGVGEKFTSTADGYDQAEQDNAQAFRAGGTPGTPGTEG
jgi:uncharacterized protein YukE